MIVLLDVGAYNFTVSTWFTKQLDRSNQLSLALLQFGVVRRLLSNGTSKYPIDKTTQYLKVDIGPAGSEPTNIAQIAVINQNGQQVDIQSITNVGAGNPNLQ